MEQFLKYLLFSIILVSIAQAYTNARILPRTFSKSNARIYEGLPAKEGQFPYQAFIRSIKFDGEIKECGGVLIGRSWVLTTASCVTETEHTTIHLGAVNWTQSTIIVSAHIVRIHPEYNSFTKFNDIALIGLSILVEESDTVQVVKFAKNPLETFDHMMGLVSGFGRTEINGNNSEILNYAIAKIMTNDDCKSFFGAAVDDSILCTGAVADWGSNPCKGDGGGPLVVHVNGAPVLAAIMSWTHILGCSMPLPVGYTRISSFVYWIASVSGIA